MRLDIDYASDSIEIGFNVTYLIDALGNMGPRWCALPGRWQQFGTVHHSRRCAFQVRRHAHADLINAA